MPVVLIRTGIGVALVLALFVAPGCGKSKEASLASGDAYAAAGKHAEAIVEYRTAIVKDPKFGEAHYGLAKSYLATKDVRNAGPEFIAAADLLLTNIDAQEKALRFLLLAGRFEDVLTHAERVIQQNPDNIDAHLAKATALASLNKVDDAVVEALAAVRISKQEARTLVVAGDLLWRQNNLGEAEANYKLAVEVDPKAVQPMVALGSFYWVAGRTAEAEALLRRAAAAAPANLDVQTRLVEFLTANGRASEAEAPLKALVAASGSGPSRLALADYYLSTRRFDEARPLLDKLAVEPGGFAAARIRLVRLDHQLGRKPEAERALAELLAKEPKNAEGLALKSGILLEAGKMDEAQAAAKVAVESDQRSSVAQTALGDVYIARGDSAAALEAFGEAMKLNPRNATVKAKLAKLQFQKGSFPMALQLATEAARQDPMNMEAHRTRVQAMTATGDRRGAEQTLRAIVATNPRIAVLHSDLGKLLLGRREYPAATQEFDRALELDPKSMDAFRGKVAIDILTGHKDKARAAVEQRLQASPSDKALVLLSVDTYAALGDTAKLEPALTHLLEIDPNNVEAYGGLAGIYVSRGRLDEAKTKFEALASKGGPGATMSATMVGLILEAQGKTDDAGKVYEKIVAKDPDAAVASNNLAWLTAEKGDLDTAMRLAQGAQRVDPTSPKVNDTLGWVYYKKELGTLAVRSFQESIKVDPKEPLYHYHLGLALAQEGNADPALAALDQALKLKPGYPDAIKAKKTIEAARDDK